MPQSKLVQAMLQKDFYPHKTEEVRLIHTHISYVFLAGDYVYKIKKPVDMGFLNFSTLEKRKFYCQEELRLNKRLADPIYKDVVCISQDNQGRFFLGTRNGSEIVEYAVKMVTIPEENMFHVRLYNEKISLSDIEALAEKLVSFHKQQEVGGQDLETGSLASVVENHDENFEQTKPFIGYTIAEQPYHLIRSFSYHFLQNRRKLLKKRIKENRIREGHGDLRIEHIVFYPEDILIFDCIEFNKRFRFIDVAAEISFLGMDLDINGYRDYANNLRQSYVRHSGDFDLPRLINFYKCYYAFTQGKVASFKSMDEEIDESARKEAQNKAYNYFDLAYSYAAHLERPALIITAGLTGTGKSVLAERLAPRLGADLIKSDVIRKEISGIPPTKHVYEEFGKGIYSSEMTEKTYNRAFEIAQNRLNQGISLIIDASFKKKKHRDRAFAIAESFNADFILLECICPEKILNERLEKRHSQSQTVSNGTKDILKEQKKDFDHIDEFLEENHIMVNTAYPLDICEYNAIDKIKKLTFFDIEAAHG